METQGLWVFIKKTKAICRGKDVDVLTQHGSLVECVGMVGEQLLRLLTLDTQGLQWTQGKNLQRILHTGGVCVEAWPDLLTDTPSS